MNNQNECLKIYCEAFGNEEPDFTKLLFENCFGNCIYKETEKDIASMFFALDCEIETKTETIPAVYIYAVATSEKLRGLGFMSQLIEEYKATTDKNKILFLRPANEKLIKFYEKLGFKEICGVNDNLALPKVKPIGSFTKITEDILMGDGEEFTLMYYSNFKPNLEKLHFIYSME